jgi:hypothetical protein
MMMQVVFTIRAGISGADLMQQSLEPSPTLTVQLIYASFAVILYLAYPVHVPHYPVVSHLVANPAPGYTGLVVVI